MNKIMTLLLLAVISIHSSAQKPAYQLYNAKGKSTVYQEMVEACSKADVVLFGELHNNPIAHWLQIELTHSLFEKKGQELILGAEMFEADGQIIMDEYLAGFITQKKFEDEMRLWNNYPTDYKPLLEFAKDSALDFIATNIPRRYANVVFNHGLDTLQYLSEQAKSFMMPLPLEYNTELNCYSSLASGGPMGGHGSENLRDAQAVKDATMAWFLLQNYEKGKLFLHFQGAYHSDHYESMNYFLKEGNKRLKIVTISTVSQDDITELKEDNTGKADFIIAVPERMTRTY